MKNPLAIILIFSIVSACTTHKNSPNIVFILADDLSYKDLSVYGQERFSTPHLDKLAEEGILFTEAYAGAPECAPSRGTLMTGLHTGHSTVRLNGSNRGQEHLLDSDLTIAEILRESGYKTAFIGKWGIGLSGTEGVPEKQGFDLSYGFYDQGRAHTFYPNYLIKNGDTVWLEDNFGYDMVKMYKMNGLEDPSEDLLNEYNAVGEIQPWGIDADRAQYSEALFQDEALNFIQENAKNPFFLYYATQLPHGPVTVDTLGNLTNRTDFPLQKTKELAAMNQRLDGFAGRLVESLKELNIYENTMIVFSSDNGYSACGYMGRGNRNNDWPDDPYLKHKGPFKGGKFSAFEGGVRIPMFVHWKGTIDPAISNETVWLVDLLPTFAALSNSKMDFRTDGIDLIPYFQGDLPDLQNRPPLYWERVNEQAVRLDEWRAYRAHPDSTIQLYAIEDDSYSTTDLAGEYPRVVSDIDSIMNSSHTESQWYHNPGDTKEMDRVKRKKATEEGSIQKGTRPNSLVRNGIKK